MVDIILQVLMLFRIWSIRFSTTSLYMGFFGEIYGFWNVAMKNGVRENSFSNNH